MGGNSVIRHNTVDGVGGGGLWAGVSTFNMSGNALISENRTDRLGGGVVIFDGNFTMDENAAIINNHAESGGGIYVQHSNFTMGGNAVIRGNRAEHGAGLFGNGTGENVTPGIYIISGGSIDSNIAENLGGGMVLLNVNFTMEGGTIKNNTAVSGGGLHLSEGTFTRNGGSIQGNSPADIFEAPP